MQASSGAQDSTFIVAHLDALRRHGKLKEGYRVEFTYRSKKHKGILELSDEGNKELCIKSLASGELYDNPGGWLEAEAARTLSEQKPGEYKSRFNAWKKITVTDEEGKNLGTLFSLRHVSGPVAASPKRPLKRRSKAEPATVAEGHGQSEKRKENVNQNDKNRQTDQAQHIVEHQGRKMKQVNQTDVELITMSVVTQNSYRKTRRGPVVEKNDSFDQALQQFAQIEDREAEEDYTIAVEPDEEIEGGQWSLAEPAELRLFGSPLLGSGSFSLVKRGRWLDMPVAIKCINPQKKQYNKSNLKRELDVWGPLRHPNIVQFYGAIMLPERLYFVMERLHMNLQQAIETWPIERIARSRKIWALQIASAVCYLHANDVLHRDLKELNVLLTRDGFTCKLADFGLATKCAEHDRISMGTPEYMAPELASKDVPHHKGMDVYSFGILLWKLWHPRSYPYPGLDPVENGQGKQHRRAILKHVADGRRPALEDVEEGWQTLIQDCWDESPSNRPTFQQILATLRTLS